MSPRLLIVVAFAAMLVGAGAAAGQIGARAPSVVTYPAAQTIPPSGKLPSGAGRSLTLNEPVGGDEAGLVVVSSAQQVGVSVDVRRLGPLGMHIRWVHFVRFGSALVPDALLPWDGSAHPTEQQNQPISIDVAVPYGTKPGLYKGSVTVTADAKKIVLPLTINVYGVNLPKPGQVSGSLLTTFGVGPQAYVGRATQLFGLKTPDQIRAANDSLFAFLSAYRIGPNSWGYGIPKASGYVASSAWWKDSAGNMARQLQAGQFAALWIPLSTNRATPGSYIAGLSPNEPEKWCGYLQTIRQYWESHGWLQTGAIPYAYPYDEPGDTHTSLLARQATTLHRCFPGARMLITATPGSSTKPLWDGKGTDDVDIWAAVDWRYYGVYTSPGKEKFGNRAHRYIKDIDQARKNGKKIFAYTYNGVPGFPSFSVIEPLSNPRMFVLWTALEGIDGILYGQGMTTYAGPGDPLSKTNDRRGESLLIYPGDGAPIPSARLEQIRSGIEDWEIFDVVRRRFGAAKVRQILGAHGLFSADAKGVKLACVVGCDLKGTPPQAWPAWSHDWSTAGRVEAARLDALKLASS
jgi:hypothetical protein